jgi:DNA polymerase III delta prime subunit
MATRKKMDLLTAVEQIVDKAKGTGLSSEFYRKADRYIKYVSEKLEMTKEQSVMMALFIDHSDDTRITISDFSNFLDCRTTRIIRYMAEIDVLEKREFVRCCRDGRHMTYRIPMEVIEAFKKNEKYVPKNCSGLSCQEFFGEIENIFELRRDDELTYDATVGKIRHLFDCNGQLLYVQKVKSYDMPEEDDMMLILFSHLFVNNNDDNIGYHDLNFLYDNKRTWNMVKVLLNEGNHNLLKAKLIEYNNDDGFVDRESFRMTTEAKRELFAELNLSSLNQRKKRGDAIKSEDIVPKKLFYGKKISAQIAELGKLLDEEHYNQVRARMKDTGFRCGFTCLFYGAPGTGKTETVLQLARQTGRNIIQVNISEIKSMWVGESEKNIKQVFDNYRAKVKECTITPILLFNEADAIIGKRQEGAERAVDKMENSIQNIILQEMEDLDGILIATTNLAQNMDKAFERRFLYKIKFEKPTVEARMSIWHEMIPSLKEEDIHLLASKYDFSGGQIENIARHYTIGKILHGESENVIEAISAYCDSERLETKEKRKIGF